MILMTNSIELEKTYLCSAIPTDLFSGQPTKMIDIYIPEESPHPKLRLRRKGNHHEMTKKTALDGDPSQQLENTISLTHEEFRSLAACSARRIEKIRVPISYDGHIGELDIFLGSHYGLVLVDFEFSLISEKDAFQMPSFCLHDVTYEDYIAGGILSALESDKLFSHLREHYGYEPIYYSVQTGVEK